MRNLIAAHTHTYCAHLARGWYGTETSLPPLLIPVYKVKGRPQTLDIAPNVRHVYVASQQQRTCKIATQC